MPSQRLTDVITRKRTDQEIYHDLMQFRVREILLVASIYDAYILEEEEILTEKVFGEYYQLNLSNAPHITSVPDGEETLEALVKRSPDMVILTMRIAGMTPFELSRKIREINPTIPILLLLNDNTEIALVADRKDSMRYLDKIFVWNGDSKIFLAMIKYIEDKINVVRDTAAGLVRVILLVEDSIRYYSSYLPTLYSEIMRQTQRLIADENLDAMKKLLRMRTRPKVLMAGSYEEAIAVIDQYRDYLLCVISDVAFEMGGKKNDTAGASLIQYCRSRLHDLPILIQSADLDNRVMAEGVGASFLYKDSESISRDLRDFIFTYLGFGDFVFRDAGGGEIGRARTMEEFKSLIVTVPDESLVYHAQRNHFSSWLMAHGEIQIAKSLQPVRISDFSTFGDFREHMISILREVQRNRILGKVIPYDQSLMEYEGHVIRLTDGSLGGKGRGMAFLHMLIQNCNLKEFLPDVRIRIPKTAVIATEEYDGFIERNGLADLFDEDVEYGEVKDLFLEKDLSPDLRRRLDGLLDHFPRPITVRSSGMFEDSLTQPFSGIYDTFMLPNVHPDRRARLAQLESAVKLVYASIFSRRARAYFDAIGYKAGEEKMAVLIQQVVGQDHGGYYYPHIGGITQSYNYYPVAYLKPEDGIAVIGYGLGKHVIDGERAHRFCPHYPKLDFVTPEELLDVTQNSFYALDLSKNDIELAAGDEITLTRLPIDRGRDDEYFQYCVSSWDVQNGRLQWGASREGPHIVNFTSILKYDYFPLARTLEVILNLIRDAMGTPVEIEFAVDLTPDENGLGSFYILQIKPLLGNVEEYSIDLKEIRREELLLYTEHSVGNGVVEDLEDLIYVDIDRFDASETLEMVDELDRLNALLSEEGRKYILIGPGRWGSRDRWLGVPVDWSHISCARIIVEIDLEDMRVDPSLGSHFFHNVTSMNIGYFDVGLKGESDFIDMEWLKKQPVLHRTAHFVHARVPRPLLVRMDGKKCVSVIGKVSG
jgi:CheY-like chemotaxis protein